MKNDIDELLKVSLTPMDVPSKGLNNQILLKVREKKNMSNKSIHKKFKIPMAAMLTVGMLALGTVTVVAAYRYLNPEEVALELEDNTLKQAFSGENAIFVNETQECKGYQITLLGSVAGKNISNYMSWDDDGAIEEDRIYTVVAIEHADGTPMADTSSDEYGEELFYVSHYIGGLNPKDYSIMSMGGGYSEFVEDGVMYRLFSMDNIEMFADKGIYVGINSGVFYDAEAYIFDETTGKMIPNTNYEGINVLFELPVDVSKADPAAAETYLKNMEQDKQKEDAEPEKNATDLSAETFLEKLSSENINEYAIPVESTRQVYTPDEKGIVKFSYEFESGAAGSGTLNVNETFLKNEIGIPKIGGISYSDSGLESMLMEVFILNEDGTVTFAIYKPKM